ncbi:agmatine deiminase family protein [Litoribacter alkaliphilus]|uniref:Agmatine deiminase family protein n=1 Tax=Litoribacter ruber TaxID=702568 RepID=A0AAP2CNR4_9BACT|nr:agmatine deiminase family protein [Litoribacter alkaliphilus]MBS9525930.1 agmatine deiminase family protein [Litoribacter alkaliphilus]
MIRDDQTNFLYLADTLPKKYPTFFTHLEKTLLDCGIEYALLPGTKDVWAVDYMPIQIDTDKFVRFRYEPPYLTKYAVHRKTISNTAEICRQLGIDAVPSDIILDGGNVVKWSYQAIMTERIFQDNPAYERKELLSSLHELLEVDRIHLIPEQPGDFTGHADGMVRFLGENTVLINDFSREKASFHRAFETAIRNTGLDHIKIPYNVYQNKSYNQANGDYINYLQMENTILLPTFDLPEDEAVERQFEGLFPGQRIVTVDSNEIADEGGVLNCVSWNVRRALVTKANQELKNT